MLKLLRIEESPLKDKNPEYNIRKTSRIRTFSKNSVDFIYINVGYRVKLINFPYAIIYYTPFDSVYFHSANLIPSVGKFENSKLFLTEFIEYYASSSNVVRISP